MKDLIITIQQNPYFGLAMSAIAVASIVYAVYTNWSSKKYKYLDHFELSKTLFYPSSKKNDGLHLYYNDREIQNVTVTNIAIWNAGNEAIRNTDLANAITIRFDNNEENDITDSIFNNSILNANVIGATNQNSNVDIVESDNDKIVIDFKFLNAGDGLVLHLLHTGNPFNLKVDLDVIGENKKKTRLLNSRRHKSKNSTYEIFRKLAKQLSVLVCIMTTIMLILLIGAKAFYPALLGDNQLEIKVTTIMLIVLLFAAWGLFFYTRKTDYYDLIPKELKEMLNK